MINKRLLSYFKKHKKELLYGIVALVITDIFALMIPWIVKRAIDRIPSIKSSSELLPYTIEIILIAILQAIFRFFWRKYIYGFSRKVEYDLRNKYFSHIQSLSWTFYHKQKVGDIMSRATNDTKAVRELCGLGVMIIVDASLTLVTCLGLMLFVDIKLAIIAVFPLPIVSLVVFKLRNEIKKRFKRVQEKLSDVNVLVQENVSGIRIIQAYTQESNEVMRFNSLSNELVERNLDSAKIYARFFPLLLFAIGLSSALTLWYGGVEIIDKKISMGSFVAFNGYLAMLVWPLAAVGLMISITQKGLASITRIDEIMDIEPDIRDSSTTVHLEEITGDIEIAGVQFSYEKEKGNVLNIADLKIEEKKITAIVGTIGSGKSTLLTLIPRIFDLSCGSITIGRVNIKNIPLQTLRKNIGFVDQSPFLFSDTIRNNITFASEVENYYTDEEVEKAANLAQLTSDIEKFPDGINTLIGERGVTLSGGQKQRIAIARALIKRPVILIMDDSFSSLDVKTENSIMRNIKYAMQDTTIIMVSHRVSTVKEADIIIVLQDGKVVESGTHDDLIKTDGNYCNINKLQSFDLVG